MCCATTTLGRRNGARQLTPLAAIAVGDFSSTAAIHQVAGVGDLEAPSAVRVGSTILKYIASLILEYNTHWQRTRASRAVDHQAAPEATEAAEAAAVR